MNGQDVIGITLSSSPFAGHFCVTITSYYRLRSGNINNTSISLHVLEAEIITWTRTNNRCFSGTLVTVCHRVPSIFDKAFTPPAHTCDLTRSSSEIKLTGYHKFFDEDHEVDY